MQAPHLIIYAIFMFFDFIFPKMLIFSLAEKFHAISFFFKPQFQILKIFLMKNQFFFHINRHFIQTNYHILYVFGNLNYDLVCLLNDLNIYICKFTCSSLFKLYFKCVDHSYFIGPTLMHFGKESLDCFSFQNKKTNSINEKNYLYYLAFWKNSINTLHFKFLFP